MTISLAGKLVVTAIVLIVSIIAGYRRGAQKRRDHEDMPFLD